MSARRDFPHPAVTLLWWRREPRLANEWLSELVE